MSYDQLKCDVLTMHEKVRNVEKLIDVIDAWMSQPSDIKCPACAALFAAYNDKFGMKKPVIGWDANGSPVVEE